MLSEQDKSRAVERLIRVLDVVRGRDVQERIMSILTQYNDPRVLDMAQSRYQNSTPDVKRRILHVMTDAYTHGSYEFLSQIARSGIYTEETKLAKRLLRTFDLAFIIPLKEEFDMLGSLCNVIHTESQDALYFYACKLPDVDCRVVAVCCGDGNLNACDITEQAINHIQFSSIILLGIAGALDKDVRLGDVVVADEIHHYTSNSKVVTYDDSLRFQYSGYHYRTDFAMVEYVRNFDTSTDTMKLYSKWQDDAMVYLRSLGLTAKQLSVVARPPTVRVGHIACGEIVSQSELYKKELSGIDRKFLAIETEAAGVARVVLRYGRGLKLSVIRGASDYADERKKKLDEIGDGGLRRYAAHNAVAFAVELIKSGKFA